MAKSQTGRLLDEFKLKGKLTNGYIVRNMNIYRYSARLAELRAEGHVIVTSHVKDSLWEYVYLGTLEDVLKQQLDAISAEPVDHMGNILDKAKFWDK